MTLLYRVLRTASWEPLRTANTVEALPQPRYRSLRMTAFMHIAVVTPPYYLNVTTEMKLRRREQMGMYTSKQVHLS